MKNGLRPSVRWGWQFVFERVGGPISDAAGVCCARGRSDRAQTTIDFAIGASVFLLAVAFVVWFVPSMFEPFADSEGSLFVLADRTASFLTEDALAVSAADPAVLDVGCTLAFFNGSATVTLADGSTGACDRIETEGSIEAIVATEASAPIDRNVNVTLHELDAPADEPLTVELDGEAVSLTRGSDGVPSGAVVATRVVYVPGLDDLDGVDGTEFKLTVRVW